MGNSISQNPANFVSRMLGRKLRQVFKKFPDFRKQPFPCRYFYKEMWPTISQKPVTKQLNSLTHSLAARPDFPTQLNVTYTTAVRIMLPRYADVLV
jgi:hypothetical protein